MCGAVGAFGRFGLQSAPDSGRIVQRAGGEVRLIGLPNNVWKRVELELTRAARVRFQCPSFDLLR